MGMGSHAASAGVGGIGIASVGEAGHATGSAASARNLGLRMTCRPELSWITPCSGSGFRLGLQSTSGDCGRLAAAGGGGSDGESGAGDGDGDDGAATLRDCTRSSMVASMV